MTRQLLKKMAAIEPSVQQQIQQRLAEFTAFSAKEGEEWFSELCYCLLTANSKAKTALSLQADMGFHGFMRLSHEKLVSEIKTHKHRFHNTKAARIVEARKHASVKEVITELVATKGEQEARMWLVENVKGLGYKEASHFMRNTGHRNLAIVDRHIIAILHEHNIIESIPGAITRQKYLEIESALAKLGSQAKMNLAHLDLALWYLKTGEVLK